MNLKWSTSQNAGEENDIDLITIEAHTQAIFKLFLAYLI